MKKTFLLLLLLPTLLSSTSLSSLPFKSKSIEGMAQPYFFALVRWEEGGLLAKGISRLQDLWPSSHSQEEDVRLVKDYFSSGQTSDSGRIEAILEKQMDQILKQEGLSFPPILFRLEGTPHLLVTSPRERIELSQSLLLRPNISSSEIEELERQVESLEVSALVVQIGGVAAYPSLVVHTSSLNATVETVAHEWIHHYLFFRPLGRGYGRNQDMTTINESVAVLAGKEIASQLLSVYYGIEIQEEQITAPPPPKDPKDFDFNREMRQTRLRAEDYLSRGEVEKAEQFMEERRQFLVQKGYNIRRLNQAYFAYHGLYLDAPGAISPIGNELKSLRQASPSLGDFVRRVSWVSSYQELKSFLPTDR